MKVSSLFSMKVPAVEVPPGRAALAQHLAAVTTAQGVVNDFSAQEVAERQFIDEHAAAKSYLEDLRSKRVALLAERKVEGTSATDPDELLPDIAAAKQRVDELTERADVAKLVIVRLGSKRADASATHQSLVRLTPQYAHAALMEQLDPAEERLAVAEQNYYDALAEAYSISGAINNVAQMPCNVQLPMVRLFDITKAVLQRPTNTKPADLETLVNRIMAGASKLLDELK